MIDSVKIKLNKYQFQIEKENIFKFDIDNIYKTRDQIKSWHYTSEDTFAIDVKKAYGDLNMYISFSAPIILFGNNLDELIESDFSLIIDLLMKRFDGSGVVISRKDLENAEVSMIHISKNFIIKNYTCSNVIYHMSKIDLSYMNSLRKSFLNDGEALYFENNSHMICIYDKLAQLKNKMQKIENITSFDNKILKKINNLKYKNILRVEIRLLEEDKIKTFFDLEKVLFKDVFKENIWKEVVSDYVYKILDNKNMFLFQEYDAIEKMLKMIKIDPNIKFGKLIYKIGLNSICKSPYGLNRFFEIISKTYSKDTIKNIKKDLWFLSNFNKKTYQYNFIEDIKKQLVEFKSLRLVNIKKEKGVKNIGGNLS